MASNKVPGLIIGMAAVSIMGCASAANAQTSAPPTKIDTATSPEPTAKATNVDEPTWLPNFRYKKYCLLKNGESGDTNSRRATILGVPPRMRVDARDEKASDGWATAKKVKLTRPPSSPEAPEKRINERCADHGYFEVPGTLSVVWDGALLMLNLEFRDNQGTRYFISRSLTSSPSDWKTPAWYQTSELHGDFQFFVYLTDTEASAPNRYLQNYRVEIFKLDDPGQGSCLNERPKLGVTVFEDKDGQCPITMYFQQNGVGAGNEPR